MNRRSPVTICLWCLLANGELLYLHGTLSGFVNNQSKSRLLGNLLNLKNLVDIGGVSFQVTISTGNLTDILGGELTISGSRKVRAIFINSTPLFSKHILHTFWGGSFFELEAKGLDVLDSVRSMAWWKYIENIKLVGLLCDFVRNSLRVIFK